MDAANVVTALPDWLLSMAALLGTGGAAAFAYRTKGKERGEVVTSSDAASQVVAATFTERGQMERLINALVANEAAIRVHIDSTAELVLLMEAEAQHRHDEAVVRDALMKRGIRE